MSMRRIQHPGKSAPNSVTAVACQSDSFKTVLKPGQTLLESIREVIESNGAQSGVLRLTGGALDRFCYYMPDLSTDPKYAVYFSRRHDVTGVVLLETASVTYGQRDGQPWLHCHAIWTEPDGSRRCGHLIPDVNTVFMQIEAEVTTLEGATFTVCPDIETNFSLFVPLASDHSGHRSGSQSAFAVRLAPNVDVCHALEALCSNLDLDDVEILGGVGSSVGAVFDDEKVVEPFVTEVFIRSGRIIKNQDMSHQADIEVSLVDNTGGLSEGRYKRGQNPVLVTFELVLRPNIINTTQHRQ